MADETRIDPKRLGQRLQEFRKARHLTQQDVAKMLGVARTTIVAIEQGTRKVRSQELVHMAELYGRSVSSLLRSGPSAPSFAVQFRASARSKAVGDASDEAINLFRQWCESYAYLEELMDAPRPTVLPQGDRLEDLPPDRAGELAAQTERRTLGLGDAPVGNLRALLEEERGLRVFFLDLPGTIAGLFSYTEEFGGCIAVNRRQPPERRLWTLGHEYGHFVLNPYEADVLAEEGSGSSSSERAADAFARSFLMPGEALARRFDLLLRGAGQITVAGLIGLSDYFGVSFQALLARLEELRRLPAGTWGRLHQQGFKVREAQAILGYERPSAGEDLYPRRYLLLAIWAFTQERIGEGELSELLAGDRLTARECVQELMKATKARDVSGLADFLSERLV